MAKKTAVQAATRYKTKAKISRPGVHSKKKNSNLKTSKNYRKKYRGQGK